MDRCSCRLSAVCRDIVALNGNHGNTLSVSMSCRLYFVWFCLYPGCAFCDCIAWHADNVFIGHRISAKPESVVEPWIA